MPCQDRDLIVGAPSGCIGCPCALAGHFPSSRQGPDASDRRLARAALLVFGAPLLLLLLGAAGTATFAADQPASAMKQIHSQTHSHVRNDR